MTRAPLSRADFEALAGQEIGTSDWIGIDQSRIDAFAAATLDDQFIHTDPVRAAQTPFGGTIAHGFLTLSLLSRMFTEVVPPLAGARMTLNYGFDSLRFLAPVRSGGRVRGRFFLSAVTSRGDDRLQLSFRVTIEIEGETRPALVADWLVLAMTGD